MTFSTTSGTTSMTRSTVVAGGGSTGSSLTLSPLMMRKATGSIFALAPLPPPKGVLSPGLLIFGHKVAPAAGKSKGQPGDRDQG